MFKIGDRVQLVWEEQLTTRKEIGTIIAYHMQFTDLPWEVKLPNEEYTLLFSESEMSLLTLIEDIQT